MQESQMLLAALKRQLKLRGLTYRQLAEQLQLSEASVKRLFASGRLSLARLEQICRLLGLSLFELQQAAQAEQQRPTQLSPAQEKELVAAPRRLLLAVLALNQWPLAAILATYRLSEAEVLQEWLFLEKLGLLQLLPGNRVRLQVSRDFDWRPDGPIRDYFRREGLPDFLASDFPPPDGKLVFCQGLLTTAAREALQQELARLRQKFAELHQSSQQRPLSERHGHALLLACRPWEPASFAALRR
jgi:transcriptional regulator with XRE-family HTH domain